MPNPSDNEDPIADTQTGGSDKSTYLKTWSPKMGQDKTFPGAFDDLALSISHQTSSHKTRALIFCYRATQFLPPGFFFLPFTFCRLKVKTPYVQILSTPEEGKGGCAWKAVVFVTRLCCHPLFLPLAFSRLFKWSTTYGKKKKRKKLA